MAQHIHIHLCPCRCGDVPRPGIPTLAQRRQISMADFAYTFNLPAPGATDVASRELTVTVNGGDPPTVHSYPGNTLVTPELVFADGALVSLTLVDVDGSGNRSPASAALTFNVVDDVPPPAPGDLAIASKRQI